MKYFNNIFILFGKNISHKYLSLCLLLLSTCFVMTDSFAAPDPAGSVVFVNGRVTATSSAHGVRALSKSDPIFNSDRIDTAENGRGQFRFTDGGLVSLMPNTTFSVEEYFFADDDKQDSAVFGLLKGGLRTITGSVGKVNHEEYELKTPVATLGIRGTEYVAVIKPANTLRVHVGRGKVVITNDHGSLEVPAGQNAIVTLGSAPEFSEKGPVFVATAPNGDRLVAGMLPVQDPILSQPDTEPIIPDYVTLTNPATGETFPANAGIYDTVPTGGSNIVNPNPAPPTISMVPMMTVGYIDEADNWAGNTYNVSPDNVDLSIATNPSVASNSYLQWGSNNGAVVINGTQFNLNDSYFTYVTGNAIENYAPTGMLNYSLAGSESSTGYDLTKFDLGLNLSSLTYTLDFELENRVPTNIINYTTSTSGVLNSGSASQGFGFNTNDVQSNSTSHCMNSDCNLDVRGFLAGQNGEAAGVGYTLTDGGGGATITSGAAALDRQ